jgi:predicted MFS family arabinose efflux permease
MLQDKMTPGERRSVSTLAVIMTFRMLGLFMILPVFALYAADLDGVTPVLIGLAIGIYGLTQALLQLPFGMLSDRFGRKPVITAGLLIFAAGSVIAALATTIEGIIIGRALQGSGAIAAALMALAADLTREEHRTKAMAFIGVSIGMAFALAMVLGPLLNHWIGVPGIFWVIACLALLGIALLHLAVPTPAHSRFHRDAEAVPGQFGRLLRDPHLLRLDIGIFLLHAQLSSLFIAFPLILKNEVGLASVHHWWVYLPVMLLAMGLMVPFIIMAEKRRRFKQVFLAAIAGLALAQIGLLVLPHALLSIILLLLLFFTAFNLLEASLPSLVSKTAPVTGKGTAMGIYSTAQFLGIFVGGLGGGWVHQHYGMSAEFLFGAVLALVWLVFALSMPQPSYLSTYMLKIGAIDPAQAALLSKRLAEIPGVAEAVVIAEDEVAYLKIDRQVVDMAHLDQFSAPEEAQPT